MCLGIRWHVQGWAGKFKKNVLCIRLGNENDMISHMLVFFRFAKRSCHHLFSHMSSDLQGYLAVPVSM